MPSPASLGPTATLSEVKQTQKTDSNRMVQWRAGESDQQDECLSAVPQSGISPSCPLHSPLGGGDIFIVFYLMSGSGLGFRHTACGALPLSSLERNSIAFSCL